ncbi:GntR family transcriptional regulator, partial [Paradevosia shaoguanensis]
MPKTLSWLPELSRDGAPLYLAVADALAADVGSGRLPGGTRLPSQRALADALGVDFTTISRAYNEARDRGLIEGRPG